MKRTIIAAVLLTVAGGTVAALPAQAAPADALLSPEMLSAMQRDLGLSKDQAVARIASERDAAVTEQTLRGTLGAAFGGAYYDATDGKLVVGVTDAKAAKAVDAAGAKATVVRNSEATLDGVVSSLDKANAPQGVTTWSVDVYRNTVTVTALPGAAAEARSFVAAAGVDTALVKVVESAEQPRTYADIIGGNGYHINNQFLCSVGFSVQGGFVTAGHCGDKGASVTDTRGTAMGSFQGSSFPGNDYAWVKVNSNWTPRGLVNNYSGGTVRVAGSTQAAVGASICRSGTTTGWHCGKVEQHNASVRYSEGTVSGLTKTSACADHGDSGGSFISGTQAQGVTSGGSGDCKSGGTTYHQPVNEILSTYGLKLVTS